MAQQIINTGAVANDGTGDPLRTAFTETNNNFTEIYTAGPVDSNVRITNNTILTLNTNGNLVLAPNGTAVVQSNVSIVPNSNRLHDLGSSSKKWDTLYTYYGQIDNATIGTANISSLGSVTIDVGNLHLLGGTNGYVLQTDGTGNLTWTAQTGGSGNGTPGGANTQVQFNDAGAFGGQSGFTFNKTANLLSVGNISAGAGTVANIGFVDDAIYDIHGIILENADLSHGATAALVLPVNGSTTVPISLNNTYGNITLGTGPSSTITNTWTFSTYGLLEVPGSIQNPVTYNRLDLNSNAVVLSSEDNSVSIIADNANTYQTWTFGADGVLSFPTNSLTIGNDAMGNPIMQAAANLNLQVVASGANGVGGIEWFDDANAPSRVAAVVVNNPFYGGNADVGIVTGDILGGGGNTYIWNFGNDGNLSLPSQGNIVGNTPNNSGYMQWVGNSSGDGSGYTTLRLIPDETLVAGDQYLIIDPTGGGHIHIRAGGTQDNSYGQLYLGAEHNFVRVIDNQGLTLQNQLVTQTTNNYADPADFTSATWFVDGGSYYIQYTSTNAQLDVDPFQDINNIYITWNAGADSATLTYGGGTYNLGGGVYKVQVNEAPTTDPTAFDTLAYTLNITTTNTVTLDDNGFNATSENDATLTGNGFVEITNFSNTEGVTIRTNQSGNAYAWTFSSQGQTVFPTLTVDLHNGGNQTAQTLQFGDSEQQAIITGPTPDPDTNAQRLIIQGQRGNGTGEGGDVYLWAGDADTNGGDIKIYAGDADVSGYGGYINLDGGSGVNGGGALTLTGGQSNDGQGGQISITPGYSGNGNGSTLTLNGGQGTGDGGPVNITAGYGGANGGAVTIQGGQSALGLPGYGNVLIGAGASTWTFNNEGNLTLPGNTSAINYANGSSILNSVPAESPFIIQVGNFVAVAGARYGVDTYSADGPVTATLPASPATGDAVFFADAGNYANNGALTIDAGSNTIMDNGNTLVVSTNNQSVGLFWNGRTWRIYNAG